MASRFWNPLAVTGCVDNGSGLGRITVSPAITGSGIVTGTTITTAGITGATGCNVTTTATVINSTTIDLDGTTFGGVYVSGGTVAGGIWTATNTSNWAASSTATPGSGGQTVPGSADTATFDANSVGGTVVVNANLSISTLTTSAFTGTIDFATNNNTVSIGANWNDSGSGAHTITPGTGNWTFTATGGNPMNVSAGANLTLGTGMKIIYSATAVSTRGVVFGAHTYASFSVAAGGGQYPIDFSPNTVATTITALDLTNVRLVRLAPGATLTVGTLTYNGTSTAQNIMFTYGAVSTLALGASNDTTLNWVLLQSVTATGSKLSVANGFDGGGNTLNGGAIISPASSHIIGG